MKWLTDRTKVHPVFADAVDTIPGPFAAVQGWRPPAEQTADWQHGRDSQGNVIYPNQVITNAKRFQSPHTVTIPLGDESGKPDAEAVDVARVAEDGTLHWDYYTHPAWKDLWDFIDKSPLMHSGIHFPKPDEDHIQWRGWYQTRLALIAAGKW